MEKTKAKPVLTETGNSDAESTGLTNAAQIARKLNNEDKEIDMSKFHKSNNSVPAASSAAIFYGRHPVAAAIANPRRQINKILCTAENAEELRRLCTENRRTPGLVNIVDRKEIDRILPREAVHQGIAAYVRELENLMENLVITTPGDIIRRENLSERLKFSTENRGFTEDTEVITLKETVERAEYMAIQKAIRQCGSIRKAAVALGVDPSTIVRKQQNYQK